ncbi:MAG: hydrogenase maturation nickel metallochaperone HypA [archaeon]
MHELSITKALVTKIIRECKEKKIKKPKKIMLELGMLTNYKKEPIVFYYGIMKKEETLLKETELQFKEIKGKIRCNECKKINLVNEPILVYCKECKSGNVKIIQGRNFIIKKIIEG